MPFVISLEKKYQGKFTGYQKFKIYHYYSLLVPTVLCSNFRRLYGQPFTETDRKSGTLTGLSSPLFDDLFDQQQVSIHVLKEISDNPASFVAGTFETKVAQEIFLSLINSSADQASFLAACEMLFDVQKESLCQSDPKISDTDLERITYGKSSTAFIYYYTHMAGKIPDEFREVLYHVAGLHQYCNDINDIYKDTQEKIITPANRCTDFEALQTEYIARVKIQNQKIRALPLPKKNKERFCVMMNSINATAIVTINRIIKLQKRNASHLKWEAFTRKELVYDNAKPLNMIRWFYHIWKLSGLH